MNKLEEICAKKRDYVEAQKARLSLDDLKYKVADTPPPRGFIGHLLQMQGFPLITEIKKASPSKGLIRRNFDPAVLAKEYEDAGASCLSVLTDEPYFQGHDDHLIAAHNSSKLPILRKDFMLDEYQIYESRALGADCVLLIIAALTKSEAQKLYDTATALRMDVLVEIHDRIELDVALKISPMMIGINSRNLKTLDVDLKTARELAPLIPEHIVKIAESGIGDHEELVDLRKRGFGGFLVGESLLRQENIGKAVQELLGK
jgi:indole-3-glycerol phosphate synthase